MWFKLDLNPHADTPVEILHVVILGFIKYFWRDAVKRLGDKQKGIVKRRLSCLDLSGLDPDIKAAQGNTLIQYAGSLVGRDFRLIVQIAIFVLYDLLPAEILAAWAALCQLVPLIFQPEIEHLENHLVSKSCLA